MSTREDRLTRRIARLRDLVKPTSKGPWIRRKAGGKTSVMQGPADDCQIAECGVFAMPERRARANARFIAAVRTLAPRLTADAAYLMNRLAMLRATAGALIEAWDHDEIGRIDGVVVERLRLLLSPDWEPRNAGAIYIAGGSSERLTVCRPWIDVARKAGMNVLEDWTYADGYDEPNPSSALLRRDAATDVRAVLRASVFWQLAPEAMSEGASSELGVALAARAMGRRVRIVVSGPNATRNIFGHLADEVFPTHEAAFDALLPVLVRSPQ